LDLDFIGPFEDFATAVERQIRAAAEEGWIVAFWNGTPSPMVSKEMAIGRSLGAQFAPVLLAPPSGDLDDLGGLDPFDGYSDPTTAPQRFAAFLLDRSW